MSFPGPSLVQKRTRAESSTPPSAEADWKRQWVFQPVGTGTSEKGALSYKESFTAVKIDKCLCHSFES